MRVLVATAIYPNEARPDFGSFVQTQVESLRSAGLDVDVFVLDGVNRKLMYLQAIPELRRRLSEKPYDIVHAHYSYVGAVACTQLRIPVMLTFHGNDLLGDRDERGGKPLRGRMIAEAGRLLGERVDGVIVQSEQMASRLRREHVHVIPHEVDLETFRPTERRRARAQLGLNPDGAYVLFAALPTRPEKNYPLAQAAVARLRRAGTPCELIVVHREPQDRLALYMSACDVLAFPSWQEGSPNVVKQAMACNMPIVSTDVGDVRQVIGGTDGCHIVSHDVGPFASALDAELRLRRRTDGRGAIGHLSRELIAARVLAAYEQTLDAARAGSRRKRHQDRAPNGPSNHRVLAQKARS